jgi:anaerobic selenocysteine-containing dehydrogenase
MMKPDRRDFLKLSGMAGVATTLIFAVGGSARRRPGKRP